MKKFFLSFVLTALYIVGGAQVQEPKQKGNVILSATINDQTFHVGDKIRLGRPAQDREQFTYVTISKALKGLGSGKDNGFGVDYAGRYVIIKKILMEGDSEFGYKFILVCRTSGVLKAWIDIKNALDAGEVADEF